MTYSFWQTGVPSTWEVALTTPEECNYFGIAAHTLHSNNAMAVLQAYIDAAWVTMPVLTAAGDAWRFDGDLLGERGAAPGTTAASLRRGVAADGAPILLDGVQESKFGHYSMSSEPATTNVFPENVRNGGDTDGDLTDFNPASDASYSTNRAVSGAGSILIDNSGAAAQLDTSAAAAAGSSDYTGSVKILLTEALTVDLTLIGTVAGVLATAQFTTLSVGSWHVLQLKGTTGASDSIYMVVEIDKGSAYADEFQLEKSAYAHTWVDGSRSAADLVYQSEIFQQFQNDITVNFWARVGTESMSFQDVFTVGTGTGVFGLYLQNGSFSDIGIATQDQDGNLDLDIANGVANWDGGWHMVTCVLKPETTGEDNRLIYFDGRLVYSDESPYFPDWQQSSLFLLGWGTAFYGLKGKNLMDDLVVMNRAATSTEILSWFNNDVSLSLTTAGLADHSDDRPIMGLTEAARSNRFRIRITGQTKPLVGVIYIGKALEMERAIYTGHTPIGLARKTVIRPNLSTGGQFLGRSLIRAGSSGSWSWKNLTAAWVREYLDAFLEAARTTPFFILWKPNRFPGEAGYCQTAGDQIPTNSGPKDKMSFTLTAEGLGVE
jgi:hypothetical protein